MTSKNDIAVIYLYCDDMQDRSKILKISLQTDGKMLTFLWPAQRSIMSDNQDKLSKFTEVSCNFMKNMIIKKFKFTVIMFKNRIIKDVVVVSSIMSGPYSVKATALIIGCKGSQIKLTNETHLVGSTIVIMPPDHPLTELQNGSKAKY